MEERLSLGMRMIPVITLLLHGAEKDILAGTRVSFVRIIAPDNQTMVSLFPRSLPAFLSRGTDGYARVRYIRADPDHQNTWYSIPSLDSLTVGNLYRTTAHSAVPPITTILV